MKTQQLSQYSGHVPSSTYLNSNKMRGISKRHRTHFTSVQVEKLEEIFISNQNPYRDLIVHLSSALNLTHKNILIWFKNRRAKEKRQNKDSTKEIPKKDVTVNEYIVSKENTESEPANVNEYLPEKSQSQVYEPPTIPSFKEPFYPQDRFPKDDHALLPASDYYNPSPCYNSQQYLYPPSYNPHYRLPDYGYPSDGGRTDYSYHEAPIYPTPYYPPAPYPFQLRPDTIGDLDNKRDVTSTDSQASSNTSESDQNEADEPLSIDSGQNNDATYANQELTESRVEVKNVSVENAESAVPNIRDAMNLSVNSQISLSHYKFNYL